MFVCCLIRACCFAGSSPVTFPCWLQLPALTPRMWPRFYYETGSTTSSRAARSVRHYADLKTATHTRQLTFTPPERALSTTAASVSHCSGFATRGHQRPPPCWIPWLDIWMCQQDYFIFGHISQRLKFFFLPPIRKKYRMHNNKWILTLFFVLYITGSNEATDYFNRWVFLNNISFTLLSFSHYSLTSMYMFTC